MLYQTLKEGISECFRSDKAHTVNVLNNFKNKPFGKLIHIVILKNNVVNQEDFYHILNHGYGTDFCCAFSLIIEFLSY